MDRDETYLEVGGRRVATGWGATIIFMAIPWLIFAAGFMLGAVLA